MEAIFRFIDKHQTATNWLLIIQAILMVLAVINYNFTTNF